MKVLAGTSNSKLCKDIARQLKLKLVNSKIKRFADGEVYVEINENIRGNSIFVVQSTSNPANDNLMELLICIDALRRSSAKNITAVIPYFGYARQDRKVVPRTAISAKLVSNLITNAGANRILSVDLHAGQIQGFFDIPVDNLFATPIFARHIKKKMKLNNLQKNFCIFFSVIISILIAALLWEKIVLPLNNISGATGMLISKGYNPSNDTIRYIFFIAFPLIVYLFSNKIFKNKIIRIRELIFEKEEKDKTVKLFRDEWLIDNYFNNINSNFDYQKEVPLEKKDLIQTTRIGISKAKNIKWRWYLKNSRSVSKRLKGDKTPKFQ